jgi:hypothetical protein
MSKMRFEGLWDGVTGSWSIIAFSIEEFWGRIIALTPSTKELIATKSVEQISGQAP